MHYRFVAPDGATFEGRDEIPEARFRRLTDGATLRLHVLPSAPAANTLAHGIPVGWALSTLVVVGLLGVAGGGVVWLLRALMAAERALDSGQTRLARVSATPRRRRHLHWIVTTGQRGASLFPVRHAQDHAESDEIVLIVDPASGRDFWSDEITPSG